MNFRNYSWLAPVAGALVVSALVGLSGCGNSGRSAPGDATPPAVSNLDEEKMKQTLPARKPPMP